MKDQKSLFGSKKDCVAEPLTPTQVYMIKSLSFGELEIAPGVFLMRFSPWDYENYSPYINKDSNWR